MTFRINKFSKKSKNKYFIKINCNLILLVLNIADNNFYS